MKKKWVAALAAATMALSLPITANAALDARETSIVPIAAFTAQGNEAALKQALADGLKNGMTVNEIKEVLVQMYAYTGFPRSLTGLGVFVNLLNERKASGITDNVGRSPTPLPKDADIRKLGTTVQTRLIGRPAAGPVYDFSPEIDTYLKEHLFGDIFASDVLDYQAREIATVSALASLPAPVQLRSHLNVCLNVGLTPEELQEFVNVLREKVGNKEADLANEALKTVLQSRK